MMKKYLITLFSLISGSIAVFSYSPFDYSVIAYLSFLSLILIVNLKNKKVALVNAFIWGFGYFLSGSHWIYVSIEQYGNLPVAVSIILLVLLMCYFSIYSLIFALIMRFFEKKITRNSFIQLVVLMPLVWALTEMIRANLLNGFAWLQFGYTQLDTIIFNGYFAVIGINGVNLLFSISCGLIFYILNLIFNQYKNKILNNFKKNLLGSVSLLSFIFMTSITLNQINWTTSDTTRSTRVTLLQGNIEQSLKWNQDHLINTLKIYHNLTLSALKQSDIIIWPEAAIPDKETNQQNYLKNLDQIAKNNNTSIALGILDYKKNQSEYEVNNNLIILGDKLSYDYNKRQKYSKQHLVPFGEYTPLAFFLKPIAQMLDVPMSNMTPGINDKKTLKMNNFVFTPAICYEIVLTNQVLNNFKNDTDFLLTVSNDAWFGDSIGPWQHLQMARARSLELGRTLIRSTNTGITAVINPEGKIISQIPSFKEDYLSITLHPNTGYTPYSQFKHLIYFLLLAFLLLILIIFRNNKKLE